MFTNFFKFVQKETEIKPWKVKYNIDHVLLLLNSTVRVEKYRPGAKKDFVNP